MQTLEKDSGVEACHTLHDQWRAPVPHLARKTVRWAEGIPLGSQRQTLKHIIAFLRFYRLLFSWREASYILYQFRTPNRIGQKTLVGCPSSMISPEPLKQCDLLSAVEKMKPHGPL